MDHQSLKCSYMVESDKVPESSQRKIRNIIRVCVSLCICFSLLIPYTATFYRLLSDECTYAKKDVDKEKDAAIALRVVNPINSMILDRIVAMAKEFQSNPLLQRYDFVLISDETRQNNTLQVLEDYYEKKHYNGTITMPIVFPTSEARMEQEFPALFRGYIYGKNVNGEPGNGGRNIMWQLLSPPFVTFFRHSQYKIAWALEADISVLGPYSLPEMLQQWDDAIQDDTVGLAAIRIHPSKAPFNAFVRYRHTWEFDAFLRAMGMMNRTKIPERRTNWTMWENDLPPNWTQDMRRGYRSTPPAEASNTGAPQWTAVTDAFYRHSREFALYLHQMMRKNVYQFGESYQQVMALSGDFKIIDLQTVLPDLTSGFDKLTGEKYEHYQQLGETFLHNRYSSHLFHEKFTI